MNEDAVVVLAIEYLRNRGFSIRMKPVKPSRRELHELEIIDILRAEVETDWGMKQRDVYEAQDRKYYITYGLEFDYFISPTTVEEMLSDGTLESKWPEKPKLRCFVLQEGA